MRSRDSPEVHMAGEIEDPRRTEPAFGLPEREMLEEWLDYHRLTLLLKCEGLTDAQRKARSVPTSALSLHGLVRHMAEVENGWFVRTLLSKPETPPLFAVEGVEDSELVPLDDAVFDDDLAVWQRACETSREIASARGLDDTGVTRRTGQQCTLRWIYVHMIEEYARHNGHADFLRELADGAVGY
jgi:uncharacterized damage-inducible protein DinB